MHRSPPQRIRQQLHQRTQEDCTWRILPRTTQHILPLLLLIAIDATTVEHIAIRAVCLRSRCTNHITLSTAFAQFDVATVEIDGASPTNKVHRSLDGAALQISSAPIVCIISVLIAHQR